MNQLKKTDLKNLNKLQLQEFVRSHELEPFRARQLFHWMYQKNVSDFSEMTTLKKSIRESLKNVADIKLLKLNSVLSSQFEPTSKFLFELKNGELVESVYMEDADRRTICVSTQVGCALKCDFCATGKMGFRKNLTFGEIVDQVLCIERYIGKESTNVVMMGMGEPFLNYDAVIQAADLISDQEGIAISKKKVLISTSGIIPGIRRFTEEKHSFRLAISLNAAIDKVRTGLMPVNRKYPLNDLLNAVKTYAEQSRYLVTFEYLLISGINDSPSDAKKLRQLLQGIRCKINIIPFNSVDSPYRTVSENVIEQFLQVLASISAPVTVRRSRGQDINGACGQLYTEAVKKNQPQILKGSKNNKQD